MSCDNTKSPTREVRHNKLYNNKRAINSKLHNVFLLKHEQKNGRDKKGNCCVWWDSGNKILNNLGFSGMLGYV
jgi:hypothetical protein